MPNIYLDWASTAPPHIDILETALRAAAADPANPSSIHAGGKSARAVFEKARDGLAACLGTEPCKVFFTSGGSEADAIPILALLRRRRAGSIVLSAIEHPAAFEQALVLERFGWKVRIVKPGPNGILDPGALVQAVEQDTELVICMAVNNETGAIQPVARLAEALSGIAGKRPRLVCDAVQALGKIPFDPERLGVDCASFSAHKIGGPRGIGALYSRTPIESLMVGGGQERGVRPGTENLQGAVGFALASARSVNGLEESRLRARDLMERLLVGIRSISGALAMPPSRSPCDDRFSPWLASLSFPGLAAETTVRLMSDSGYFLSAGSACSSGKKERRVLDAMGIPEELSLASVRVSIGPATTTDEIDGALAAFDEIYHRYKT